MKQCKKCGIKKPFSEYHKHAPARDGFHNWCKPLAQRRKTDAILRLRENIGKSMRSRLLRGSKNNNHWEDILGYTVHDLKKRLSRTMPKGYTWKDYLAGELHIDHIIPVSAFNITGCDCVDFHRCWALDNLQLLPARDNIKKGARLDKPFQPYLPISVLTHSPQPGL